MAKILSLESSTDVCSVAVHEDSILEAYIEIHITKSHSEKITLLIEQALVHSNSSLSDVDAVALSMGPGSYTGLRVGTSTAKGLCMALDKPLIAINTLKAMASEVREYLQEPICLCPMIDARRMEVYSALFSDPLQKITETSAEVLTTDSYSEFLEKNKVAFFGNGSDKFKKIVKHSNATFLKNIYPKAKHIGYLAFERYKNQEFEDLHFFEPFYLKDFVMTNKL